MRKNRGGILVNIIPSEFQGQKIKGPQAPKVFGLGTSQGTIFTRIPLRLFHLLPFFCNPALVTGILLQTILPLSRVLAKCIPLGAAHWGMRSDTIT